MTRTWVYWFEYGDKHERPAYIHPARNSNNWDQRRINSIDHSTIDTHSYQYLHHGRKCESHHLPTDQYLSRPRASNYREREGLNIIRTSCDVGILAKITHLKSSTSNHQMPKSIRLNSWNKIPLLDLILTSYNSICTLTDKIINLDFSRYLRRTTTRHSRVPITIIYDWPLYTLFDQVPLCREP